jgi:hypothetical protein
LFSAGPQRSALYVLPSYDPANRRLSQERFLPISRDPVADNYVIAQVAGP